MIALTIIAMIIIHIPVVHYCLLKWYEHEDIRL